MTEQSNIERVTMRRVHTIRALRWLFSDVALAALVLVLALWGIGREVWVAKVLENGPADFFGKSRYFLYAFEHTRLIVQALALLTLASVVYLARETARLVVSRHTYATN